jgi:hypothetical protein
MRTTLHHQDGLITCDVSDHDDFCVLAFRQGGDTMHIHLPRHMSAVAHLMADAFGSNMRPKPIPIQVADDPVDDVVVAFPSGGARQLTAALWIAGILDEDAAHAIERRDLP